MSNSRLRLAEVDSMYALESIVDEWSALWHRVPDATPFQTPEWILSWWREFGDGDPLILTLRDGDALVGIVPLFIQPDDGAGNPRLIFIGTGITDYLDALLEPGFAAEGGELILAHVADGGTRWDRCDLEQLRSNSPLLGAGPPLAAHDWRVPQQVCPVLRLPNSLDELSTCIPGHFRDRIAYDRRRLAREGTVTVQSATAENLDEMFDSLVRLHRSRWRARGGYGVLTDSVARFHRGILAPMFQRGALRMYALQLDGETVAAYYGFLSAGRACYYLSGFAPELEKFSPGTLAVAHAMEAAVNERARDFDFLRGGEPYKYRWGAHDTTTYRRSLISHGHHSAQATEELA